jgi:hypothetical protein
VRRREDQHPGPLPLPPHPASWQGPHDAGQPRLRLPRGACLPGRLRHGPRPRVRPLRPLHRHQAIHGPGHPGHDLRALRLRHPRVLGSSTAAPPTAARPPSTGSPSASPTPS